MGKEKTKFPKENTSKVVEKNSPLLVRVQV